MAYRIEPESGRDKFGNYRFRIYRGEKLVAYYWHDYRGDEHGIDFVSGKSAQWPVGRMTDFVEGGGPEPLVLSARGVAYMDEKT
ncbi:MAG TPA: hypothetical protein VJR95_03005 [Rhodanobacter sp.]|nr:hypothetical protein [Rhodanobacter sp.]